MRKVAAFFFLLITVLVLTSCASNPYAKTNRAHKKQAREITRQLKEFPPRENRNESALNYGDYRVGTTNFNLRKPNFVVIHHTAQESVEQTLKTFTLPRTQVSAHYVIGENGKIYHMLNDYLRSWHGGIGQWGTTTDLNSASIGIELDNDGTKAFPKTQIESLIALLKVLKKEYNIPTRNFIGHSDIAPTRKVDPNRNFPWEKLAEEGFGLWYNKAIVEKLQMEWEFFKPFPLKMNTAPTWAKRISFLDRLVFPYVIPNGFDADLALKTIGYDVSDPVAARKAFKLHFIQEDLDLPLSEMDLKVLYALHKKL